MPRLSALFLSTLLIASSANAEPLQVAPAPAPARQPSLTDGPRFGLSLGAGLAAGSFYQGSFSRQLTQAGFQGAGPGFYFRLPIEMDYRIIPYLAVGLSIDSQFGSMTRERDGFSQGYHTITPLLFVRPSFQIWDEYNEIGTSIGVDLGAGYGTTLWVVRDEVDIGRAYRLRCNLAVSYVRRGFGASGHLGAQIVGESGLGPRSLSQAEWSSFAETRLEYRW